MTDVYPLTKPVPTIVMTASSVNLPDNGVTVLTIGTLLEVYDAAAETVPNYYPFT